MFKLKLYQSMPYRCPYIPANIAYHHTSAPGAGLSKSIYSQLINLGYRRSGERIHIPNCHTCQQCVSLRVPVASFSPSRSQRRTLKKNNSLKAAIISQPDPAEYYSLYQTYIHHRHPESENMHDVKATFSDFLFSSWSESFVIEIRLPNKKLVCVSICDPLNQGWSAVYTFYDINFTEYSLGTYAILSQINLLRQHKMDYLYLGYWIRDCNKMNYKKQFRPCEGFIQNRWTLIDE